MNEADFKHTWVVPRNAWYIKVYLWIWMASPKEITFCKLFWGYALCWFGLPTRIVIGILTPFVKGFRALKARRKTRRANEQLQEIETEMEVEKGPSWMQRRLSSVEHWVSGLVMFLRSTKVALPALQIVGGLALLGSFAFFGYALFAAVSAINWTPRTLRTLRDIGIYGGGTAVGLVTGFLIICVIVKVGLDTFVSRCVLRPLGRGTKSGALTFKNVMVLGYHSVKSNTCPRVVIDE